MKTKTLILALSLTLAATTINQAGAETLGSIDKVFGSAHVASGQHYHDVSLVNGSIDMDSNSSANDVSVVNGSITLRDNVQLNNISTVNGDISAGKQLQVNGTISTVNGGISSEDGTVVDGDISTVNGDITLSGSTANASLYTVNGDISLHDHTVVKGDLIYKPRGKKSSWLFWLNDDAPSNQPTLYIAANAVVEGQIILQQKVQLKLENPAMQEKVVYQINDGR